MTTEEKNAAIQSAYEQALAMQSTDKPTYQGTYDQQIQDVYDKITNRDAFSYDLQGDPLYQQMKDRYINQGKLAMKDTMGTAAGLTGGYGSSYSQSVGQQQYDAYLQNLMDQIPELWQNAYNVYQDEGTNLQNQYSMLRDLGDTEYNRYRNELSDWQNEQDTAYNKWVDAYNRVTEQEETDYNREQNESNTAWSRQQTLYSNLYQLIGSTGYSPSDDELAAAGMSRAQADALIAAYQTAQSSGSGSGSGSGTATSSYTGNAAALESELNTIANKGATTSDLSSYATAYANEAGGISSSEARGLAMQVARETGTLNTSKYSGKTTTTAATTTTPSTKSTTTSGQSSTYVPSSSKVLTWIQKLFS